MVADTGPLFEADSHVSPISLCQPLIFLKSMPIISLSCLLFRFEDDKGGAMQAGSANVGTRRPAEALVGLTLKDGWLVDSIVQPAPKSTGGHFSVGYLVKRGERTAFLKALDFTAAFQDPADFTRALQAMTTAYNFERDLLTKCRDRKMNRVATSIDDGQIFIDGFGPLGNVCYLIFDMADGDIRRITTKTESIDLAWCLRSLHHAAVGLAQLHQSRIAHQDLKPSNVLYFSEAGSKLADLGRASDSATNSPYDLLPIPGDMGYAPFEQFYSKTCPSDFSARQAADMYLLGSLIFFFFAGCSATQAIAIKLHESSVKLSNSDFQQDLPYLQAAFHATLVDFRKDVLPVAKGLTDEIVQLARALCEPDPAKRGDMKNIGRATSQYNLERYISRFNVLAKRMEVGKPS